MKAETPKCFCGWGTSHEVFCPGALILGVAKGLKGRLMGQRTESSEESVIENSGVSTGPGEEGRCDL